MCVTLADMSSRRAGATTDSVAANIMRIRAGYRLSLRDLADSLGERGVSITAQSLSAIEKGNTAITVDLLTAIAAVLDVSPTTLLMPYTEDGYEPEMPLTGVPHDHPVSLYAWLMCDKPLDQPLLPQDQNPDAVLAFRRRSRPAWMRRD